VEKMATAFENTIAEFIAANGLFQLGGMAGSATWPCEMPSGGILVAVSGGADSMALLHALHSLKFDLTIAHINHQLRGRCADEDEAFVIQQAHTLGLPIVTRRVSVAAYAQEHKVSIETAARQLRMESLVAIAKEKKSAYVATAHHKEDNAETIVHRFLRGTGFRGLAGIYPSKKFDSGITFVRPLLCVNRSQILTYLNELKVMWRHDHTNDDQVFTRNFIRHSLLPALQDQSRDSLVELMAQLSARCRNYIDLLNAQVDQMWPQLVLKKENNCIELDPTIFASAPISLKPEIVRRALLAIGSGERDLTQQHYQRILRFAEAGRPDKNLMLPNGFIARGGKTLVFGRGGFQIRPTVGSCCWKIETQILDATACDLQKFKSQKTQYIEWFDADTIIGTPTIRPRKRGDSFWPIGLAAPKKIGKFLTDARIDNEMRKSVCVVEDTKKIIWVAPLRASEETKITAATQRILQITCSPQRAVSCYLHVSS
jgi:tRNA(Ile)-lysidine synthase